MTYNDRFEEQKQTTLLGDSLIGSLNICQKSQADSSQGLLEVLSYEMTSRSDRKQIVS